MAESPKRPSNALFRLSKLLVQKKIRKTSPFSPTPLILAPSSGELPGASFTLLKLQASDMGARLSSSIAVPVLGGIRVFF